MKPRNRPGKVITGGKSARAILAKAKPVVFQPKVESKRTSRKEGRGGERAHWDIDYEEGVRYAREKMPGAEYENFSHEGTRRSAKKGGAK